MSDARAALLTEPRRVTNLAAGGARKLTGPAGLVAALAQSRD